MTLVYYSSETVSFLHAASDGSGRYELGGCLELASRNPKIIRPTLSAESFRNCMMI